MSSTQNLTPAERARQLGNPEGDTGIAIAERLSRINEQVNHAVFRLLALQDGMGLLEIGFGNGKLLDALMQRAENLTYTGIDISATMVSEAVRNNASFVAAGRAAFHLAAADAIPFPDATFDRVFAVNVIYFWPQPESALREIRRVLCPTGTSIIAAVDPETAKTEDYARPEFGFHIRDQETLAELHRNAGFSDVAIERHEEVVTTPEGKLWARQYNLVRARP